MEPFDLLTEEDKTVISQYISSYANCEPDGLDKVLRSWNSAKKESLLSLFNGRLRIKVPVEYDGFEYVKTEIRKDNPFIPYHNMLDFKCMLEESEPCFQKSLMLHIVKELDERGFREMTRHIMNINCLFETRNLAGNRISALRTYDEDSNNTFTFTRGSNHVVVCKGMKTMRALQKIAALFEYPHMDEFYRFRDRVSAVRSVGSSVRELVLSIHPIDYLTMSDNACGWSSCLSWMRNGTYSSGVIEMLNSESTFVAYFENTEEDFVFNFHKIPNKSYRVLVSVFEDFMIVGQSYPYRNDSLSQAILKSVQDVLGLSYDIPCEEYYSDTSEIAVETYGMYNDIAENPSDHYYCAHSNDAYGIMTISGVPTCMCCGEPLTEHPCKVDGDRVGGQIKYCRKCKDDKLCVNCGHIHKHEDIVIIDRVEMYPSLKRVDHHTVNVCKTCLDMDHVQIEPKIYVDKHKMSRYNDSIDYSEWKHIYHK